MKTLKMSARNAAFQQFEALKRNREKRTQRGLFFLEGVHPIEQAIANGWAFEAFACAEGARLSGWAQDMLRRSGTPQLYQAAAELMAELSDREQPCELIALAHARTDGLSRMAERAGAAPPLYLLFDRAQNPGNLGTVIRSADAFGAAGLLTTGHSADFYDPQCIRASVGAVFALPFAAMASIDRVEEWIAVLPARPRIVGTSARGEAEIDEVDFTKPTILLIGNETFGLSKAWKEACDLLARIPISGSASSLNVGSAASICLYEAARQRKRAGLEWSNR